MKYGKSNRFFSALFIIKTLVCLILTRIYAGVVTLFIMELGVNILETPFHTFIGFFLMTVGKYLPHVIKIILGCLYVLSLVFGALLCCALAYYLFLKVFGIFKDIEKFHSFKKEIIYILLSFFVISLFYTVDEHFSFDFDDSLLGLRFLLAYILHKLFQYLTKKFPTPFNKIGYYSSIEFYKSLVVKIGNRFKPKNQ